MLASVVILAAFTWQSAVSIETGAVFSATGFDSYPQIGLFLALQLVAAFGSRYWGRRAARFAGLLVAIFSLLAIAPIAATVISGEPRLLQVAIEKATGISDWVSQLEFLETLQTNLPVIAGIVLAMFLLVVLNVVGAFKRRSAKPEQQTDWVN